MVSVVTPVCLALLVSPENRDLMESLVSVEPPDLLDLLDWPELLERLVVRELLVTMVPLVVMDPPAPRETAVSLVLLDPLDLLVLLVLPELLAHLASLVNVERLVPLDLLVPLVLLELVVLLALLVLRETEERLVRLEREATRDTEDSVACRVFPDLLDLMVREDLLVHPDLLAQEDLLDLPAPLVRMA